MKSGSSVKAAESLDVLARLNAGLGHGYSQVGKFMTVYPMNEVHFRELVRHLFGLLGSNIAAPTVPFDYRYAESNIYYRYGSFVANGSTETMLRSPGGEFVPDRRDAPAPGWATPPFEGATDALHTIPSSPLSTQYHVFNVISQRGKGGVYEAIDIKRKPSRICIIKEGRRHGETAWDGRDGQSRVENEAKVLADLRAKGLNVPRIYDAFAVGSNSYLVLEQIKGKNLQNLVAGRKRRLPLGHALYICKQISRVLAEIHAAGWFWRDCKPANLLIEKDGAVRPIDIEGACRKNEPDHLPWSTPNFTAPEVFCQETANTSYSHIAEDLFALGTCLFFVMESKLPPYKAQCQADKRECQNNITDCARNIHECAVNNCECICVIFSRRGVPGPVKQVILRLLSGNPVERPSAEEVFAVIDLVQAHLAKKVSKSNVVTDRIE